MKNTKTQRLEALARTKGTGDKTFWTKVGVAFSFKNQAGYSLKLEFMPVSTSGAFEFILVEPKVQTKKANWAPA